MEKFQIMGKKLEHHGHILDFYTYELKVPNGNTAYWDVLEHKGASAIIPVDEDGKIILVSRKRLAQLLFHSLNRHKICKNLPLLFGKPGNCLMSFLLRLLDLRKHVVCRFRF